MILDAITNMVVWVVAKTMPEAGLAEATTCSRGACRRAPGSMSGRAPCAP